VGVVARRGLWVVDTVGRRLSWSRASGVPGEGSLGGLGCRGGRWAPITAYRAPPQVPVISAVAALPCPAAARSWLPLGSQVVESLGGLGDGVGDGLVPVHVRPAGAQLPYASIVQRYPRLHARRRDNVGFGGALD